MTHVVFLRSDLSYSGATQRTISTAHALVEGGSRVTIVTRGGSRTAAAASHGFSICKFELEPTRLSKPFLRRRLIDLLIKLKPTSLHVSIDNLELVAPIVAQVARRLALPYVIEATRPSHGPVEFDRGLLRKVIIPAESLAEPMVNRGRLPRDLLVLVPGSPPDKVLVAPDETWGQRNGLPVIGCTGSFDQGFAGEWFLKAAELIESNKNPMRFVMLGEGPNERVLRRFAREVGLAHAVTIGVPTTNAALATLSSLDIHVSCRTDTGPGWLALQTMRLGIPNLFAAAGEAFSLVKDQHNGILIQPGDVQRLASEITRLVSDPERARAIGVAGRNTSYERSPRTAFEAKIHLLHDLKTAQ